MMMMKPMLAASRLGRRERADGTVLTNHIPICLADVGLHDLIGPNAAVVATVWVLQPIGTHFGINEGEHFIH